MVSELDRFIDPALAYNFTQGPDRVQTEDDARRLGINCEALVHLALKGLFGCLLPPNLLCYEMFVDKALFVTIPSLEDMRMGDVVWFGPTLTNVSTEQFIPEYDRAGNLQNWSDCPVQHLAIHAGEAQEKEPLLLHATHITCGVEVWPLTRFARYARYEHVRRIGRLSVS